MAYIRSKKEELTGYQASGEIREIEIRKVVVAMQGVMNTIFSHFFRETGHVDVLLFCVFSRLFHFRRLKSGLGKFADIPQNRRLIVPKP